MSSVVKNYGNKENQIEYMRFINDALRRDDLGNKGPRVPYAGTSFDFNGEQECDKLLLKIKTIIKKDRIRLGEFF